MKDIVVKEAKRRVGKGTKSISIDNEKINLQDGQAELRSERWLICVL